MLNITNYLNFILIILGILSVGIPIYYQIKRTMVNKIWKQIILFYKRYELLVPNLSLIKDEYGNIGWNKLTLILWKQGLLYLSVSHFISKLNKDYKNIDKIAITELRKYLNDEGFWNICKSYRIWINLNKKLKLVANVMSKFQLTKENITLPNYKYVDYELPFHIKIHKHSITLYDQLDSLRLWGFKNDGVFEVQYSNFNLSKIEKEEKATKNSFIKIIKNKNFLINLSFGTSKKEEFCICKIGVFSIYFNDDQIEKIDTIFNWNFFWKCEKKTEDDHLTFYYECLKLIEVKFNLNEKTILESELIFFNNYYDRDVLNKLLKIQKNQTT